MGRIVIKDGIKWDYDWKRNAYLFIEYVPKEKTPKKKKQKKVEE